MLTVHLEDPRKGKVQLLERSPVFLTSGTRLEVPATDPTTDPLWDPNGPREVHCFTLLEVDSACAVGFEDESGEGTARLGPFDRLRVVDGVMTYGGEVEKPLARYDDQAHAWYVYPGHRTYATAVLTTAEPDAAE